MRTVLIGDWTLNFDEGRHEYSDSQGIIPGVSSILAATGKAKGFYGPDTTARDRGTRIHAATELMDTIGLTPLDFPEEIHSYLTAWNRYLMESGAKILEVEKLVGHREQRFAGTMDRLVELAGLLWILDLKSGAKADWHRIQLAAYANAYSYMTGAEIHGGIAVYPKSTGKYTTWPVSGIDWKQARIEWIDTLRTYKEHVK